MFQIKNLTYPGFILAGKLIYDEYRGKPIYNTSGEMLKSYFGKDFVVQAAAQANFIPTFPLPENAEYARDYACLTPPKRRRLFVAHIYNGLTKKTLDTHKQHLCNFKIDPDADFVYAPPICYLDYVKQTYPDCVDLGTQNCYPAKEGNYTGEVSVKMAKELGAKYVLVGSSHRRCFLGETDKFIRAKVKDSLSNEMKCIIFLSNTTGDCDDCSTEQLFSRQLEAVFPAIQIDEWDRVAFVCELPQCRNENHDHSRFTTIKSAQRFCHMIREKIADRVGNKIADTIRILYGGDICHGSAPMFLTQEDIDGAVFCPHHDSECFVNIVNSGMLVDKREEKLQEKKKNKSSQNKPKEADSKKSKAVANK